MQLIWYDLFYVVTLQRIRITAAKTLQSFFELLTLIPRTARVLSGILLRDGRC